MEKRIGIIGAGVAGLHMGLRLRQSGLDVTIITDREPEAYRTCRLLNTVAHHAVTLERERELGLSRFQDETHHYFCHHHHFGIPENRLVFRGDFVAPSRAVDYRVYLPALMEDFESAGGRIEYQRVEDDDVASIADRFDLLAVGTGKGPLGKMFPAIPELAPFDRPQRHLCVGLYRGVRDADLRGVTLSVAPTECDLIEIPTLTFEGMTTALLMETVPGSEHEAIYKMRYDEDPAAFEEKVLSLLEKFHPTVYERVDHAEFGLCSPRDLLQGALLPKVRETHVDVNGTPAVAIGDVHVTMDPCLGQGANVASYGAVVVAEEIAASDEFDAAFVDRIRRRRDPRVMSAFNWTNANMMPPSPEIMAMVLAMSRDQQLCDEFTTNFSYPEKQWGNLSSAGAIRNWIGEDHVTFAAQAMAN